MKRQLRIGLVISVLVLVSLVLGALTPGVVQAEGDVPEAPPVEEPPLAEPGAEEAAGVVEALAVSGTVIVQDGAVLPLASQAALEAVCEPDPWFYCAKPTATYCVGGKSIDFNNFEEAKGYWKLLGGYGYLYLYGNASYAGSDIDVTANWPGLKGIVWDTTHGTTRPLITSRLSIHDYTAGFTLQGLTISGGYNDAILAIEGKGTLRLTDVDVKNTLNDGIVIENYGPVILTRVSSSQNFGRGATLETAFDDGTGLKNYGGITINSSSFNGNGTGVNSYGLDVTSGGAVLLNGVSATGNGGNGASIVSYALYPIVIKNSVFSHNIDFAASPDYGEGLIVIHNKGGPITLENVILDTNNADGAYMATTLNGSITLKQVRAGNNGKHGVYISGSKGVNSSGAKAVTVLNSSFYNNANDNLAIFSSGAVRITNLVSTSSQGGNGLSIANTYALPQPVTILGAVLSDNHAYGAEIYTKGAFLAAGIKANGNSEAGMNIQQPVDATGSIVISGSLGLNLFNYNQALYGIMVISFKNVNLASIQAVGNVSDGVVIVGNGLASNVTLVNVEASGSTGVDKNGVYVYTSGVVLLDRVTANGNTEDGISIDNHDATYARAVTVRNSTANNNGDYGIEVISVGAISLSNVNASGNVGIGAKLNNSQITLPTQVPQGITVIKATFDNNRYGLTATSDRKITLTSVNASGNSFIGIQVDNSITDVASQVVINGFSQVNRNGFGITDAMGIFINTTGSVAISGVNASWNKGIDPASNFGLGIYINQRTPAAVTISNTQVDNNSSYGIWIGPETALPSGPVTLSGVRAFANGFANDAPGVYIISNAKVTVTGGYYMGNAGAGIYLKLDDSLGSYAISATTVLFGNDARAPFNDGDLKKEYY
jgi:hypothetical protein